MNHRINQPNSPILSTIILAVFVAVVFVIAYKCLWIVDELFYQLNYAYEGEHVRLKSFADVLQSQYTHYFTTNGRTVAHILVQAFCGLWGQTAFAVCNAAMNVAFVVMILKHGGTTWRNWRGVLSVSLMYLLTYVVPYGPPYLVSYMWMTTLGLAWLYVFERIDGRNWWQCALLGLFSFIAGWGHEVLNIGLAGALVLHCITHLRSLNRTQWVMGVAFCFGTLMICLSPATRSHVDGYAMSFSMSLLEFRLNIRIFPIFVVYVICLIVRRRLNIVDFCRQNSLWLNAMVILLVFTFVIGCHCNQQLFGIEIISMVLLIKLLPRHGFGWVVTALLAITVVALYSYLWNNLMQRRQIHKEIMEQYEKSPDGVVYCDLGTAAMLPDNAFTWFMHPEHYVLSVNYVLKADNPNAKTLVVKPKVLKDIDPKTVETMVVPLDDETYLMIRPKNKPTKKFYCSTARTVGFYTWPGAEVGYLFGWGILVEDNEYYQAAIAYPTGIPYQKVLGMRVGD